MTPRADDGVRAAPELLRRLLQPSSTRSGRPRRLARVSAGRTDPRRDARPSCSRRSETGSANEGVQVPHRRRPGRVQPVRLAAPERRPGGMGRVRGRAVPRRHPRVPARPTCRTGSHPLCTRSSSTARIDEQAIKVVAPRGRLVRRDRRLERRRRARPTGACASRVRTSSSRQRPSGSTAGRRRPTSPPESARLGFIAARIAEELGGVDAHLEERSRQSEWLVERLALD